MLDKLGKIGDNKKLNTSLFIERAISIHGNKYDYSKTSYMGCKNKVIIICPKHGDFLQSPDVHMRGSGCLKCGVEITHIKQLGSTQSFVEDARRVHGDRFDYSKVDYKNVSGKVIIICKTHGEFLQNRSNHVGGRKGCPKCRDDSLREKFAMGKEEFIARAKEKFGNTYDYSRVNYENCDIPILINCPKHGLFTQTPYSHLNGKYGCLKCSITGRGISNRNDLEFYVDQFRKKFGDKYDYSIDESHAIRKQKIKIICPKHGEFKQNIQDHLNSPTGCPKCSEKESSLEVFFIDLLNLYSIEYKRKDRTIINPREIDILIEKQKIGIEANGIYWHSEKSGKDSLYHEEKYRKCLAKGYKLLQFFEYEIKKDWKIVKSITKQFLDLKRFEIKSAEFIEINKKTARSFIKKYSLNKSLGNINYGIFLRGRMLGVLSIQKFKNKIKIKNHCINFLFDLKNFIELSVNHIKSTFGNKPIEVEIDKRFDTSEKFLQNGFVADRQKDPVCSYFQHAGRTLFTWRQLKNLSNKNSIAVSAKWNKIWDAGHLLLKKYD